MNQPKSVNHPLSLLVGFFAFISFLFLQKTWSLDLELKAVLALIVTTISIALVDMTLFKVHRRASTGLDWTRFHPSLSRAFTKWVGLLGTLGLLALFYRSFPEYNGAFYHSFYKALGLMAWPFLLGSFVYIYCVDALMAEPEDSYWQVGLIFLLQFEKANLSGLKQHVLGWLVKAFFMPLMFTYFVADIRQFNEYDFASLTNFKAYFDFLYNLIFLIDVGFVSMGYAVSLKLLDSHIRSTEPTLTGWVVALVCYQPFWSLVSRQYLNYGSGDQSWGYWFGSWPVLYTFWGVLILLLFGVYVWSSVIFGYRFSNLTHRGIITNGPYRWLKHPAYVCKNLAYWCISLPFLSTVSSQEALKKTVMLLVLNLIYYFRAKTEEKHLSQDSDYLVYSHWVDQHGLWAKVKKVFSS